MKRILTALITLALTSVWAQNLVVFDGETKKKGGSWADPKNSVTLGVTDSVKFNGKSTLQLKGQCKNWWGGGGWNWKNWSRNGDDVSQYDFISFYIKKSSGNFRDICIQLADGSNKASSKIYIVKNGYSSSIGSDFSKVVIPLDKFIGKVNKKNLTSLNISFAPATPNGGGTVNIGQIEFGKGEIPAKKVTSSQKVNNKPSGNPAAIPTKFTDDWKKWKIIAHKARAKKGNINILFIGDSITSLWNRKGVGQEVWDENFAPMGAAQFGVSGDKTQEILWRLSEGGELDKVTPKVIVYLGGVNNIFTNETPDNVVGGIKATIDFLHKRLPDSKIILMGLLPTGFTKENVFRKKNQLVNNKISKFADNKIVFYQDMKSHFVNSDGSLKKEFFREDGIHPNSRGYKILAKNLKPEIEKLLK